MALPLVGQSQAIASITDTGDTGAVACNLYYEVARKAVLSAWWWRFATKRAVLAQLSSVTRDGWGYVYNLPADCAFPQYIWAGVREEYNPKGQRVPFDIEYESTASDAQKRVLLADMAPTTTAPLLVYTFDQSNPAQWPTHFLDAVAWQLAARVAIPLSIKADKAQLAWSMSGALINQAIAIEQRGRESGALPVADALRARR